MSRDPTRVAVLGASGKMGQAIIRELRDEPDLALSGALTSDQNPSLGDDAGLNQNINTGVMLTADPVEALSAARVAIDVSQPAAMDALLDACLEATVALVIGTTGLSATQMSRVETAGERIPVLLAANFSQGVCVLAAILEQLTEVLGPDWDVEITESHHKGKRDVPSGTALALGEQIAAVRGGNLDELISYRTPDSGPTPHGRIGMHSIRAGDLAGEHRILFAAAGEQIELLHRATDRAAFARGALAAVAWLADQEPGLYGMADVFGL